MANQTQAFCVTSYNSGGMGLDRQNFINSLTLFSDIICIQEHFLLDTGGGKHSNTHKLKKSFGLTHDMYIKPAQKSNEVITKGRGSGGLVTMWKKCYTKYVTNIQCDSYRMQALKFTFPEAELLLFNLYFMVDTQNRNYGENELLFLLAEIDRIITLTNCRNLLLVGDLNCDFSRHTHFVNTVNNYVNSKSLNIVWSLPDDNPDHNIAEVNFTYSNTINNVTHSSIIDHFIVNDRLYNALTEANVINSVDNHSSHHPIYLKFNMNMLNLEVEEQFSVPKPSWDKATPEERSTYQNTLDDLLNVVQRPDLCEECVTLQCQLHTEYIDQYATDICEAIDLAARDSLPAVGGGAARAGGVIPGWNEYVKPYQDESLFWDGVWKAAGSPNQGELFILHRDSKMQYKYAIRRLKRARNRIQHNKFASGLLQGGVNIFSEIKKFRGQTQTLSSSIDGAVGSQDISEHFSDIYEDLYSKHTLGEEFQRINEEINLQVNQGLQVDLDRVNSETVRAALDKLKTGKSDVQFSFNSDCLINSSSVLIEHMTQLFRWFLRTGRIPAFLLLCTLVPIVKDNLADITNSDNYRAIAIGSLVLKWFDWLILILESDKLSTDELQFGFQARSSTYMCSWAVSTVVDHYNRSGRPVYACAMDLSKAFDLVSWEHLFPELMDRGVSPLFLRCLLFIYSSQTCNVRWGSVYSHVFTVRNGVRQGAVSSPILFCIYINKMISKLRHSSLGCQLQGVYLGIWVYADDIILLSPSRSALQSMTTICENYAQSSKLKFSTHPVPEKSKTKCLIFTKENINMHDILPIMLNSLPLPFVNEVKHLGNILQTDNSMNNDMSIKRAKFISKIHSLNQEFYFTDPYIVMKLYSIYACSFHGSSLWNLYSDNALRLYSSWNVAVRILFDVPRETHRYFIEPISRHYHIKTLLCSRFISFCDSLFCSSKLSIRLLSNLCKHDYRTVLCTNLKNISRDCNCNINILSKDFVKTNLRFHEVPQEYAWKVPILLELLQTRTDDIIIDGFAREDISDYIDFLCSD